MITAKTAARIISGWGSYMHAGDPGACFYAFHVDDGRPINEEHRAECIAYADRLLSQERADEGEPGNVAELETLLAWFKACPLFEGPAPVKARNEFELPISSTADAIRFDTLDAFTRAYVECMFFTDTGPDFEESGLETADFSELSSIALDAIQADCAAFQSVAAPFLDKAYSRQGYDAAQAGHDFWLTRCGHGTGFWDRPSLKACGLGDALSALCGFRTAFDCLNLIRGDDGKIYLE